MNLWQIEKRFCLNLDLTFSMDQRHSFFLFKYYIHSLFVANETKWHIQQLSLSKYVENFNHFFYSSLESFQSSQNVCYLSAFTNSGILQTRNLKVILAQRILFVIYLQIVKCCQWLIWCRVMLRDPFVDPKYVHTTMFFF